MRQDFFLNLNQFGGNRLFQYRDEINIIACRSLLFNYFYLYHCIYKHKNTHIKWNQF
jgi:hypothetical protein